MTRGTGLVGAALAWVALLVSTACTDGTGEAAGADKGASSEASARRDEGPVPLSIDRCDDPAFLGCRDNPAPPGTQFVYDDGDRTWTVTYEGATVDQSPNDDPDNPEALTIRTEMTYAFDPETEGPTPDATPVDVTDLSVFDFGIDLDLESPREFGSCGYEATGEAVSPGRPVTFTTCFRMAGPESLVGGRVSGELALRQRDGYHADLLIPRERSD